ncbi:hypothetical protein B484DRAFT_390526, partial [Ochromonadaceae sp. CCMP2298]
AQAQAQAPAPGSLVPPQALVRALTLLVLTLPLLVLTLLASTIPEGDEQEDDELYDEEEEERPMDAETLEVLETFNDHSSEQTFTDDMYIPRTMLQQAMVRLFNRYVTQDSIEWGMENIECEGNLELNFEEFLALYHSIKESLSNPLK